MNAKTHISILTDLLRDVDLEARMMTLIKVEDYLLEPETFHLESIKHDLEIEKNKLNMMLLMVEKAIAG